MIIERKRKCKENNERSATVVKKEQRKGGIAKRLRNKKEKVLVLLKKEVVGETLFSSEFNCVFTHRPATIKLVVGRERKKKEKETLNVRKLIQ